MRYDFNKEDDPIPTKVIVPPSPTPSPTPTPTPSSSANACATPPTCGTNQVLLHGDPIDGNCAVYYCVNNPQNSAFFLLAPEGSGTYGLNEEFSVSVTIWSQNESANLFKALLEFDPSVLEVVRIEKGTVLTNWTEDFFENTVGEVSLVAGLPSPGLKTTEGNDPIMAKIIFKAKRYVSEPTIINLASDSRIFSDSTNENILGTLISQKIAIPFPSD